MVPTKQYEDELDDEDNELTKTAQDVTDTVIQLRMETEEKQRQIIILQQRLVRHIKNK